MTRDPRPTRRPRERVLLTGVRFADDVDADGSFEELRGLVAAADADVVGVELLQRRARPDPATLLGSGKVAEVRAEIDRFHPDAVVVDNDLTPAQGRNLEKAWSVRVIDRSELILDIFARRARTRQARLQVELAQNEYIAPRLRRMWTHLERMEGAIGTRGPGETQLETDKRLLRKRIQDLRAELVEIERRKQREVLTRADQFTIGLVGYTNAGKSTLLNRLTGADEFVADMLFATLDTRTRQWRLPDGRTVLLSDTVGFLERLPHHLVASFHATLEETLNADLLLHVVDASHPRSVQQMAAVEGVLGELSSHTQDGILVLNKVDLVPDPIALQGFPTRKGQERVCVSAHTGEGIDRLTAAVARHIDALSYVVDLNVHVSDGRLDAQVRRLCTPLEDEIDDETGERRLRLRLTAGALGNLRRQAGPSARFTVIRHPPGALLSEEERRRDENLRSDGDPRSDDGLESEDDPR